MQFQEMIEARERAKRDFEAATVDNLVELVRKYLAFLETQLRELYSLPNAPGKHPQPASYSSNEAIEEMGRIIRHEIEQVRQERDRIADLLEYFEEISGSEVVETFNRLKYQGRITWRIRGGVTDGAGTALSIIEAAKIAGRLRREEYVAQRNNAIK